ncbi:hypothetical protein P280DRAFT_396646 [Massarina eburnea CBS 473.64]|uniref:Zn(2)-C6 fungal-type domain-containing protein n=1 Tax=Massarina eburnea CBS 473.64 TaxID=1395130 RepID=A0A6A6S7H1_9PLEO|nr:hypothetical protein P280DRAFT_396646 [Massarina eburnea CBS 473.64]
MTSNEKGERTRRTVKACVICHKKKVRCDIDEIDGTVCTPCARDGYECVPRERKRKRFTFSPSPLPRQRIKDQNSDSSLPEGSQPNYTGSTATDLNGMSHDSFVNAQKIRNQSLKTNDLRRRLSSTGSLGEHSPLLERHPNPTYSTVHQNMPLKMTDSTYGSSSNVSYLGRLEYLRNDVPVNDDDGLPGKVPHRLSDNDIEILKLQRVDELPPRPVRESLMNAFWARCYPWTPVVERSWIDDRGSSHVSLLLQHAIFLAGSRVSTPHPNYPPEDFYKKARILFWMGAEENPIITIAATLLMHWYNPEGPERVSLDTSSFWLRICIGLAYQVGLHREPTGKPDAGLRRRLWWSLVVRDCLINAGHGRPRGIDLKLADVSPISILDFEGAFASANLFAAYVGISCILGDLTQSYLRKHGLQEHKKSLEDRLFRWLKTLPEHMQLCRPTEGRPLKPYDFEVRQLHVQYFTVLVILNRPTDPKLAPSIASLLASSFVASIFEDFMARDELRFLGPIFTFYCLTAGMAQLSCYRYAGMVAIAEENLAIMGRALEELSKRWPSAVGSLKHLMDVREKVMQRPSQGYFPDINMPPTITHFFNDFGPELCRMWHPIHQRLPQTTNIAPRELETAGILQGLRTPATQPIDLDVVTNAALQQQMMDNQVTAGASLEPTLLQPQEWFGPYGTGGIGNWLMLDWDQAFGW